MNKAVIFYPEKLVKVEGVRLFVAINIYAILQLADNNVAHSIGVHVELRHLSVRIMTAFFVPVLLSFAFISVCPVEDSVVRELLVGQSLERCTAKM